MLEKKIARVFARKTNSCPDDDLAFFDFPDMFEDYDIDEVRVSCSFTYDKERAEQLAKCWGERATVTLGGPAYDDAGGDFVPGMYLKKGIVITSRGCPNSCWFCDVHKREGGIRELPITEGHILQDSNILACSDSHISKVFAMLKSQKEPVKLLGGLESAILTDAHVGMLWGLRPRSMFFAYDTPDDLEPLRVAGKKLRYADFTRGHLQCYVLIGHPKDNMQAAEKRLLEAWDAGFLPFAMLWRDNKGEVNFEWKTFQRTWARPAIVKSMVKSKYLESLRA